MRKIIKFFFIGFLLLIVLLTIYFGFLYIKSKSIKCNGDGWDGESWSCGGDYGMSVSQYYSFIPLRWRCKIQGGEINEGLTSWAYIFHCDIPSKDAGKVCYSGSDCNLRCIVDKSKAEKYCESQFSEEYLCPDDFSGRCESGVEEYSEDIYYLDNFRVRQCPPTFDDSIFD
jgi:hypothetical protein